jgi:hypothetical protein
MVASLESQSAISEPPDMIDLPIGTFNFLAIVPGPLVRAGRSDLRVGLDTQDVPWDKYLGSSSRLCLHQPPRFNPCSNRDIHNSGNLLIQELQYWTCETPDLSQMQLWMGAESRETQGLSQVQNQD